ncbi:MAG: hypothetical protein JW840_05060 [Candidatus Thermoplasmatota archaeon]|nr:hypothetical protein [Candidatus Thermoplasmatota archaeon]
MTHDNTTHTTSRIRPVHLPSYIDIRGNDKQHKKNQCLYVSLQRRMGIAFSGNKLGSCGSTDR